MVVGRGIERTKARDIVKLEKHRPTPPHLHNVEESVKLRRDSAMDGLLFPPFFGVCILIFSCAIHPEFHGFFILSCFTYLSYSKPSLLLFAFWMVLNLAFQTRDVDYSQLRVSYGLSPNSHDLDCPTLKLKFAQFYLSAPTP
ncbi:hypothetical protein VNO77_07408 [Canavalia gladiata]|uniref:Uncharacterized protein n=1 Tax=Canavalia gladiata TaxID=3824 RepID=A0AAN9M7K9_CANGL